MAVQTSVFIVVVVKLLFLFLVLAAVCVCVEGGGRYLCVGVVGEGGQCV